MSVRTIYRDIEALGEAGIPVYTEPGRFGGVQLVDGYRTRLTGLTAEEAESLFVAGPAQAVGELGLGTVLAAAQLKVLAALPPELRSRAVRVQERFHLDAPGWFRAADAVPELATLAEALWADRRVAIGYERRDQVVARTVEPLGIVLKAGVWYLLASCDGDQRTYRVSRVRTAEVLDERFDRPEGFDLAAVWAASSAAFLDTMRTVEVVARLTPFALPRLREGVEAGAVAEAEASVGEPDVDGWTTVRFRVEHVDYAHDLLLRLGAGVEVLAPANLRARMAATAHALAERYGEPAPTGGPAVAPGS